MSTTPSPVAVQELNVTRIAGVTPESAFTLEGLPSGLILLHGPNGCGKSTTASALLELLWPNPKRETYLELRATVKQKEELLELEARGRQVVALRENTTVPHPLWTAPELRHRYYWSLQTLLEGQDGDLAAALAAEMAGGVDFHVLATNLGWDKTPSAPQKLSKDIRDLEKTISSLNKEQEHLQKEADERETLRQHQQKLLRKRDRATGIRDALELLEKDQEQRQLEAQLAETPQGAIRIQPGDGERSQRLQDQIQRFRETQRNLQQKKKELEASHPLPDFEGTDEDFNRIRRSLEAFESAWRETSRDRERTSDSLEVAKETEARLRTRLGIPPDASSALEGYDLPEFRIWADAVFEVLETEVRQKHLREDLLLDPEHPLPDPNTLQELLVQLRSIKDQPFLSTLRSQAPFLITLLLFSIALNLLETSAFPWLPLLPPGLFLIFALFSPIRTRLILKQVQRFLAANGGKEGMTPSSVQECIRKIEQLQEEPYRRERFTQTLAELSDKQTVLDQGQQAFESLGLQATASREWIRNFLEDLQTWRNAAAEVTQLDIRLQEQEKRLDTQLDTLRKDAEALGHSLTREDPLLDASALRETVHEALTCRQELRNLLSAVEDLAGRLSEAESERGEIGERLGLSVVEPAEVKRLSELHREWDTLFRHSEVLKHRSSELRKNLEENDPELLTLEKADLLSLKTESEAAAEEETEIRDQLSKLEQRIESAGAQRGLHEALEALEEKRRELEGERARHAEVKAGQAILEWLRDSCRTEEQPEVLEEANRLLAGFTGGQLQLTLDLAGRENAFRAARPGQSARPLDQLSTGERTQVLMSARLAFLTRHERAQLPLLIDEALGTSDDERADAMMQALLKVAAEGRQVFYFTAQSDEVGKWIQAAERGDFVRPHLIDLQALRTNNPVKPLEFQQLIQESENPARQAEESLHEWAERLGVPQWTPHQPVENIPLFLFLQQEEAQLTKCLEYGLRTWGPLKQLIESGSSPAFLDPEFEQTLLIRSNVLECLASAWRIGRPPPIDPAVVMESGAVSETFAEPVAEALKSVDYKAPAFLEALDNKVVSGFRRDKIDQLRDLFYEKGNVTDETPLTGEEMIAKALSQFEEKPGQPVPEPAEWRRMLSLLQI